MNSESGQENLAAFIDGTGADYAETVDFDPAAAGVDNHTSNGNVDVFLSKFGP
jgi:hypothetical protein